MKELLERAEKLYAETGHYYGLRELPLYESDPLKLERFHGRLLAASIAAREATRMIAANPMVREVGELACAYYTPEGHCLVQSTGIIIHIPLMGEVIEWMIRNGYEEEGLREGDIFTSNDNAIAGMHPADVYDISPLFYRGELVGWAGVVIMETEIGATVPGPMPSTVTERYFDGLRFTAERTGANFEYFSSTKMKIKRGVRYPDVFLLDRVGALAALRRMAEELKRVIDEFGYEYYKSAIRELIEIERRAQLERVRRRTVPGKYSMVLANEIYLSRAKTYSICPPYHAIDRITLVPWEFHILPDGRYYLDFDGAGAWGWHNSNTTPSAIMGGACLMLTQTIAYTGTANHGTLMCIDINCPYDTYVNPSQPNIATSNLFAWPIPGGSLWLGQQARSFYMRGFIEEVEAGPCGNTGPGIGGTNQYGKDDHNWVIAELSGGVASGAFGVRDGVTGHVIWLPPGLAASVEIWELVNPVLYLQRGLLPDAYGWGKFRSGHPMMSTYMVHGTDTLVYEMIAVGTRVEKIFPNSGLFGGYPSLGPFTRIVSNTNMAGLIREQKPLVHGEIGEDRDDLKNVSGVVTVASNTGYLHPEVLKEGDVIQLVYGSLAGGIGDPLERDPQLVKEDLDNGLVTHKRARLVHGVEAVYDEKTREWAIRKEETERLRKEKREERRRRAIPVKEWYFRRREDIIRGRLPAMLKRAYNESLAKGKRWPKEFRRFWGLPDDFLFDTNE